MTVEKATLTTLTKEIKEEKVTPNLSLNEDGNTDNKKLTRRLGYPLNPYFLHTLPFLRQGINVRYYGLIPCDVIYNLNKLSTTVFFMDGDKVTVHASSSKDKNIRLGILIAIAKKTLSPSVSFDEIWKNKNDRDVEHFLDGYVFSILFNSKIVKNYSRYLKLIRWLLSTRVKTKDPLSSFASGGLIIVESKKKKEVKGERIKLTIPLRPVTENTTGNISVYKDLTDEEIIPGGYSVTYSTVEKTKHLPRTYSIVEKTEHEAIIKFDFNGSLYKVFRTDKTRVLNMKSMKHIGFKTSHGDGKYVYYYFKPPFGLVNITDLINDIWG